MEDSKKEWFEAWFESPYYDLLYTKRNEQEAAMFIDNLLQFLQLPENARILDLACGKGRHSTYLNKKGFEVTGTDLSERSIAFAKSFQNKRLHFQIQDMRIALPEQFELILNLFTSFGYFESDSENGKVLQSVHSMLRKEGLFVIDYLNGQKIPSDLDYSVTIPFAEGKFIIHKRVENNFVLKEVQIVLENEVKEFTEKVRLYSHLDFNDMFKQAGLDCISSFGDYDLNQFDPETSDRMIFITKKNNF